MLYLVQNAAKNTTAAPLKVATGNTIKTMLQVKPLVPCKVIEWGVSFDAFAAAAPGSVELIEVDVAATVTAFVNADITPLDGEAVQFGDPTSNYISVGTSASGFTSTGEGTVAAVRNLAGAQLVAPTNQNVFQLPLGREGYIQAAKFARIRMTFGATVNAYCYMILSF